MSKTFDFKRITDSFEISCVMEFVSYNKDSGIFTWLPRSRHWFGSDEHYTDFKEKRVGKQIKGIITTYSISDNGEDPVLPLRVYTVNKKMYTGHDLAFLLHKKRYPYGKVIYYDGDFENTKWENLIEADYSGSKILEHSVIDVKNSRDE